MAQTPRFLEILLDEAARLRSRSPHLAEAIVAAMETAVSGGVIPVSLTTAALIRSAEPGVWMVVDEDTCQCEGAQQHERCMHQLAWQLYTLTMDRLRQELEELP